MHYNELFETGTLEFINMQKKAEAILKNELYANADETSNPNDVGNEKPAFGKRLFKLVLEFFLTIFY